MPNDILEFVGSVGYLLTSYNDNVILHVHSLYFLSDRMIQTPQITSSFSSVNGVSFWITRDHPVLSVCLSVLYVCLSVRR